MRPNAAINKAVAAFAGKRVLVAGDLMLDRYWVGEVDRISPEAPVPIVRKVGAFGVPGGAANTACNVAALGARATSFRVSRPGRSGRGAARRCCPSAASIARMYRRAAGRPTTVKLRIVAHDQQIVRIDDEDTAPDRRSLAMKW